MYMYDHRCICSKKLSVYGIVGPYYMYGHRVLCKAEIMVPTEIFIQDPCPVGLPEI